MANTSLNNSKLASEPSCMKSIEELQQLITKKVDGFCRKNGEGSIFQPVNYIMQLGGKRMRPVLCLMSANLFTDDIDDAVYPALAIEVFHNFTLMHDDIMDNAPLRRGKPTVHEKWNRDVAILSGDAMVIQSYQLLMKTNPASLQDVLNIFNKTAIEVCEGQQLDMDFQKRTDVSVTEYMEMIRLKTSVLLGGAMKIGACIGKADESMQNAMYEMAIDLGLSFQLWDDYLDAFGNSVETGKQSGGDILEKKKTFLMLHTMEKASESERILMAETLSGNSYSDEQKIELVLSMFKKYGADAALLEKVEVLHTRAIARLDGLTIHSERKKMLRNFALSLKGRKS